MKFTFAFLFLVLLMPGCAIVVRGTTVALVIETSPANAQVSLANGLTCFSPCSLTVKRKGPLEVTVEKEGFESAVVAVGSYAETGLKQTAAHAGNWLFDGGVIPVGLGVDIATGAMNNGTPNPLFVELVALSAAEESVQ
jgi:hypothetical protein